MNWYKKSCLLTKLAKMTRDIQVNEESLGQEFEENVKNLHELEYKAHRVNISPAFTHYKRRENIMKRLHEKAWDHFVIIRKRLIEAFVYWKNQHQIQNAEAWTKMVFDHYREMFGSELKEIAIADGIYWGNIQLTGEGMVSYVDLNKVKKAIRKEIYNDIEAYEYSAKEWLNKNHKGWEDSGLTVKEYIEKNFLIEKFARDYLARYRQEDAVEFVRDTSTEKYFIDEEVIKKAIREYLFPQYMTYWGNKVQSIINNVDQATSRLNKITEESNISEMASAVSLALNVMHVGGNVGGDYLEYGFRFLDELGNIDVKEWEDEVAQEFGL